PPAPDRDRARAARLPQPARLLAVGRRPLPLLRLARRLARRHVRAAESRDARGGPMAAARTTGARGPSGAGLVRAPQPARAGAGDVFRARTAAAGQLVGLTAGRYAPYPSAAERPPRGPIRNAIRVVLLAVYTRRQAATEADRTALEG